MVKRCSAPDCPINAGQKIYMPYFLKDSKYREIWKKRVNRGPNWSPGKTGVLCEFHFEEDQFEQMRVDGKKKLKSHAVPSKF
ncbi:THAP domain-containing protein 4-like, partial [Mycetomoellerius zeteki]